MGINKNGQAEFEDFQEVENTQASIKKANSNNEQELDGYQFYEY